MTITFDFPNIFSFITVTILLLQFTVLDLKNRRIENKYTISALFIVGVVVILTGHLLSEYILHIVSLVITCTFAVVLFKIGSLGGADVKALMLISLGSPGIEFNNLGDPIYESAISVVIILILMLIGAVAYSKKMRANNSKTPIVPFMLVAYLLVQCIGVCVFL